jgi:hypothetical protein
MALTGPVAKEDRIDGSKRMITIKTGSRLLVISIVVADNIIVNKQFLPMEMLRALIHTHKTSFLTLCLFVSKVAMPFRVQYQYESESSFATAPS